MVLYNFQIKFDTFECVFESDLASFFVQVCCSCSRYKLFIFCVKVFLFGSSFLIFGLFTFLWSFFWLNMPHKIIICFFLTMTSTISNLNRTFFQLMVVICSAVKSELVCSAHHEMCILQKLPYRSLFFFEIAMFCNRITNALRINFPLRLTPVPLRSHHVVIGRKFRQNVHCSCKTAKTGPQKYDLVQNV